MAWGLQNGTGLGLQIAADQGFGVGFKKREAAMMATMWKASLCAPGQVKVVKLQCPLLVRCTFSNRCKHYGCQQILHLLQYLFPSRKRQKSGPRLSCHVGVLRARWESFTSLEYAGRLWSPRIQTRSDPRALQLLLHMLLDGMFYSSHTYTNWVEPFSTM